jgi:Kef-type K+ transport system membrane component KefB
LIRTQELFNVLFLVALALLFARGLGFLFYKLKQPAVIGEIIAGIILGAIVILFFSGQNFFIFDYRLPLPVLNFHWNEFMILAEVGILFLLFISGLETQLDKLKKTEKASTYVAIGGVILPLSLGFLSGVLLGFNVQESVIIGLILTATSVGVTVRTLMDLHVLDTEVGTTILGGAVIDDVIGIILLAFALGIESIFDAVWIGLRILIFFLIFLYLGLKIIDRILSISEKIHLPKAFLSISLAILLLYSFFADKAGISGIIGAFVAGILIGQNVRSSKITDDVKAIGYGFFIPIFFVYIGSSLWDGASEDIVSLWSILIISAIIIIVAILGKIIGCFIGAKISGLRNIEALQIGIGMIPRMELALIIVTASISHGLLVGSTAHTLLAVTIIMTIATTLVTPFLIKATFKQ